MSYEPEDFLCDQCLLLWKRSQPVSDLCERCLDKVMDWMMGAVHPADQWNRAVAKQIERRVRDQ